MDSPQDFNNFVLAQLLSQNLDAAVRKVIDRQPGEKEFDEKESVWAFLNRDFTVINLRLLAVWKKMCKNIHYTTNSNFLENFGKILQDTANSK